MNHEKPARDVVPGGKPDDPRDQNGTGEHADEAQLGVTEEEVRDLEDDAKGG